MERGQFFTTNNELKKMVFSLCRKEGRKLEPSAGSGHLTSYFNNNGKKVSVALEIDDTINFIDDNIIIQNFFDYSIDEKFDTIFGNPPYVRFQLIEDISKIKSKFSSLNLYLYFIEKSFYHLKDDGELIFIIPREFLTSSRASVVRELLHNNGTITDIIDYQEQKMFDDASPYIIIIRYEKGNFSYKTKYDSFIKKQIFIDGFIKFDDGKEKQTLDTFFDVKVGIVSGDNNIYKNDEFGNIDIICSDFLITQKRKKYIFYENNIPSEVMSFLEKKKELLINRKIKSFNESNWFLWGAVRNIKKMRGDGYCIYVNSKTRNEKPFFKEKVGYFDGSILALFPKKDVDLDKWVDRLNNSKDEFFEQGMITGNKYQFTQRGLSKFLLTIKE